MISLTLGVLNKKTNLVEQKVADYSPSVHSDTHSWADRNSATTRHHKDHRNSRLSMTHAAALLCK